MPVKVGASLGQRACLLSIEHWPKQRRALANTITNVEIEYLQRKYLPVSYNINIYSQLVIMVFNPRRSVRVTQRAL